MEESILKTIAKLIGGIDISGTGDGPFDMDLVIHINTYLQSLNQIGVGVEDFQITGPEETWGDFLQDQPALLTMTKSYLYTKVKLMFDPPSSSTLYQAMEKNANELEWRLNTKADRALRVKEPDTPVNPDNPKDEDPVVTGTTNYEDLENKPSINGEILMGDKSFEDLGELTLTNTELKDIIDAQFNLIFGGNENGTN